jgi:hypothetical protein
MSSLPKRPIKVLPKPGVRPPREEKPVPPPSGGRPPIKVLPKPGVRPPVQPKPTPRPMPLPPKFDPTDPVKPLPPGVQAPIKGTGPTPMPTPDYQKQYGDPAEVAAKVAANPNPAPYDKEATMKAMANQMGGMKKGGAVKKAAKRYVSGGSVSSASKRGDGIAQKGKTRGKMC